jgi:hypothetical protein
MYPDFTIPPNKLYSIYDHPHRHEVYGVWSTKKRGLVRPSHLGDGWVRIPSGDVIVIRNYNKEKDASLYLLTIIVYN